MAPARFRVGRCAKRTRACLALAGLAGAIAAAPVEIESELSAAALAAARLSDPVRTDRSDPAHALSAQLLARKSLGGKNWYLVSGMQLEAFSFPGAQATPERLQDIAAIVGLEYHRNDEPVAGLVLRPGWYFEQRPIARAWDVPFQLISGVPLTAATNGVVGIANGRFYHHPLPIFGVITTLGSRTRAQLVFPEPALIFSPDASRSWRIRGELVGAGFRGDARAGRSVVEYSSYQVGVEFRQGWSNRHEIAVSTGVEAARNFDYFHEHRRWRGSGAMFLKIGLKLSGGKAAPGTSPPSSGR